MNYFNEGLVDCTEITSLGNLRKIEEPLNLTKFIDNTEKRVNGVIQITSLGVLEEIGSKITDEDLDNIEKIFFEGEDDNGDNI